MATVTFTALYINLASDPSWFVVARRQNGSQGGRTSSVVGEVRSYGNGRMRAVLQAGKPRSIPVTFRATSDQIDTLVAWAGQDVWIRDARGRRERCVYFEVGEADVAPDRTEVTLALTGVN